MLYPFIVASATESVTVIIPKGSANPEVDITKLTPRQWYSPSKILIGQNNTVTWINKDTESHTVTSGTGEGLESLVNQKKGTKNGIFDSGVLLPRSNWTHQFENPGVFTYFCSLHPWMEGTIVVKKAVAVTIPDYPVNALGNRQTVFPVHTISNDKKYDIDMGWNPTVLLVGSKISFVLDFSEVLTNKRLHLLPYEFVIFQNGDEILRKPSLSQVGSDVQKFIFTKPGVVKIRIENVGENEESFTTFNSIVYENLVSKTDSNQLEMSQSSNLPINSYRINTLTLVWITYIIIIGIPGAVALVYILYRKGVI